MHIGESAKSRWRKEPYELQHAALENGRKTKFTLDEAVSIKEYLEEDLTIEELFREE